jgi:hypothetical protein
LLLEEDIHLSKRKKGCFKIESIGKMPFNRNRTFYKDGSYDYLAEELTYELLVPNKNMRLNKLKEVLDNRHISYEVDSEGEVNNVIVRLGNNVIDEKAVVLGAHYDIVSESFGINDNTCAVALLIAFIINAKDFTQRIDVVFFDKEEDNLGGSKLYVERYKSKIKYTLIFDIIGVGDTLVYNANYSFKKIGINIPFKHLINKIKSDNLTFIDNLLPVGLICAVYDKELTYMNGNEYYIQGLMLNSHSYHGDNDDDRIEIINFKLIEELKNSLLRLFKDP